MNAIQLGLLVCCSVVLFNSKFLYALDDCCQRDDLSDAEFSEDKQKTEKLKLGDCIHQSLLSQKDDLNAKKQKIEKYQCLLKSKLNKIKSTQQMIEDLNEQSSLLDKENVEIENEFEKMASDIPIKNCKKCSEKEAPQNDKSEGEQAEVEENQTK
jgi:hypothetical protein